MGIFKHEWQKAGWSWKKFQISKLVYKGNHVAHASSDFHITSKNYNRITKECNLGNLVFNITGNVEGSLGNLVFNITLNVEGSFSAQ